MLVLNINVNLFLLHYFNVMMVFYIFVLYALSIYYFHQLIYFTFFYCKVESIKCKNQVTKFSIFSAYCTTVFQHFNLIFKKIRPKMAYSDTL